MAIPKLFASPTFQKAAASVAGVGLAGASIWGLSSCDSSKVPAPAPTPTASHSATATPTAQATPTVLPAPSAKPKPTASPTQTPPSATPPVKPSAPSRSSRATPDNALSLLEPGAKYTDISVWQDDVNWRQMKRAGYDQVVLRGAFGTREDGRVENHWKNAVRNGISPTLYTWVVPNRSPKEQAKTIADLKQRLERKYPPPRKSTVMFDVEDSENGRGMSRASRVKHLDTLIRETAQRTGQKPSSMILYTGKYYWDDYYGSKQFGPGKLDLNLVLANYNFRYGDRLSSIPWPEGLGQPDVVQYTESGRIAGIKTPVDMNVVVGKGMHG